MSIKLRYLIAIIVILIVVILLATVACLNAASKADNWENEIERRKYKKSKY